MQEKIGKTWTGTWGPGLGTNFAAIVNRLGPLDGQPGRGLGREAFTLIEMTVVMVEAGVAEPEHRTEW